MLTFHMLLTTLEITVGEGKLAVNLTEAEVAEELDFPINNASTSLSDPLESSRISMLQ